LIAYLTSTLAAIVNGHKQSRIDELFAWHHPTSESKFRQDP